MIYRKHVRNSGSEEKVTTSGLNVTASLKMGHICELVLEVYEKQTLYHLVKELAFTPTLVHSNVFIYQTYTCTYYEQNTVLCIEIQFVLIVYINSLNQYLQNAYFLLSGGNKMMCK